jgi:hypothetical protein
MSNSWSLTLSIIHGHRYCKVLVSNGCSNPFSFLYPSVHNISKHCITKYFTENDDNRRRTYYTLRLLLSFSVKYFVLISGYRSSVHLLVTDTQCDRSSGGYLISMTYTPDIQVSKYSKVFQVLYIQTPIIHGKIYKLAGENRLAVSNHSGQMSSD